MKANAIVRIIIWSLVLVVLSGILLAFLAEEAYLSDYSLTAIDPSIPETELSGAASTSGEELYFDTESVSNIIIEWVAGNITISARNDIHGIRIQEYSPTDSQHQMIAKANGKNLKIQFSERKHWVGIHGNAVSKDLVIEVPADWICQELDLDVAATNLEIRNLTIREVDIDGASGTCNFTNCNVSDLDIDTASGDVVFRGTLDTLDFDAASASFMGEFQNTPKSIDMDGMSGSLDIALPEDCGYSLNMDGMSTRFSSDFQGTEIRNGAHIYGDGRCRIQVDGMNVDVTIRKLDAAIQ